VTRLLILVLSIAIADAINPGTLGPAVYLATAERPLRRLASFAGAFFAVNLLAGILAVVGPGQLILSALPHPDKTARYVVELALGLVLIAVGLALLLTRLGAGRHPPAEVARDGRGAGLLGASIAAAELPTALPYFAAIAAIVGSGLDLASQLLLVTTFNVIFISPVLLMIVGLAMAGERAQSRLRRAGDWLRTRWRPVFAILALAAGALLALFGASGLAGLR
jgi:cytochrome c biogenesis protein CcdA